MYFKIVSISYVGYCHIRLEEEKKYITITIKLIFKIVSDLKGKKRSNYFYIYYIFYKRVLEKCLLQAVIVELNREFDYSCNHTNYFMLNLIFRHDWRLTAPYLTFCPNMAQVNYQLIINLPKLKKNKQQIF